MLAKEIENGGIPVAHITAMTMLAKQIGSNRIVTGTKIQNPCGDPSLPEDGDRALREEIVKCALGAVQTEVSDSTVFIPKIKFEVG